MIKTYIIAFVIFSIIGWLYEYLFFDGNKYDGVTYKMLKIKLPFLPIYGICGVALLFLYNNTSHWPFLLRIIIASILINSLECCLGLLSYKFYNYQTWKYEQNKIPLCFGYTSVVTIIWWTLLIFILFKLLHMRK